MTRMTRPLSIVAILPVLCLVLLPAAASHAATPQQESRQQRQERDRQEKQLKKEEDQRKQAEEKQSRNQERLQQQQTKTLREYENLRKFAQELYGKDADFKAAVEGAYAAKKREHSEFAFAMNTRDQDDDQVTRTGDTFKIEDTLYDNPLVQQYVNRLGQSIVPKGSSNLYAFRVTLNPVPLARALSTGTIYVSTGFISLADNEAQLAYILAHEIAHVEQDHWKEDVLMQLAQSEYAEAQQGRRRLLGRIVTGAAGGLGAGGGAGGVLSALMVVNAALPTLMKLTAPGGVVGWDSTQEDQADRAALGYMVERSYDPEAVPPLYVKLAELAKTEKRASFGFIADPARIVENERSIRSAADQLKPTLAGRALTTGVLSLTPATWETVGPLAGGASPTRIDTEPRSAPLLTEELKAKLAAGEIIADSGKFRRVMSELKRDNGIQAFYYDMFRLSLNNLTESLAIYAGDPVAHFAYGRSLWLTARTSDERGRALDAFNHAINRDTRRVVPQARLFKALSLIDRNDPSVNAEIVATLKQYVEISRLLNAGALPADMNAIYDSLLQAGDMTFVQHPSTAVWTPESPAAVAPRAPQAPPAPAPAPPTSRRTPGR